MERTTKIAMNGLGEFFVHIYCADGSVSEDGPFRSIGEALDAEQFALGVGYYVAEADWDRD